MASEVGVLDLDPAEVVKKGRLQPGRMFLVDTEQGRIVDDEEIKNALAAEHPYGEWLDEGLKHLDDLPEPTTSPSPPPRRAAPAADFGYTTRRSAPPDRADGAHRRRGDRLDGYRHADRGAVQPVAHVVRLLPAAVRPGHQPAARTPSARSWSPRSGGPSAPRATCWSRPRSRATRSSCRSRSSTTTSLAKLIHIEPDPRFPAHTVRDALPGGRGGGGRCAARWSACATRCRDAIADGAHHRAVGPATPTRTWPRSRRCWRPRPCTTT